MLAAVLKPIRLAILKAAIRIVERAGLSVVQIKRMTDKSVYLVARNGEYMRLQKVKKP